MSAIFPFMAAMTFGLPELSSLPVEMWALILRCMDPVSLLAAIRASRNWMSVARCDPILRNKIRQQLQTERRQREEFLLNPALFTTVIRNGPSVIFRKNTTKTVIHNPIPTGPYFGTQPPTFQISNLQGDCQKKNCQIIRKHRKVMRTQPYKTMRF